MTEPIVFVTPRLSAEPRSGGEIRSLRLVTALAARTPVTLAVVGHARDPERLIAATGVAELCVFPTTASPLRKRVTAVRHRWPIRVARDWVPELAAWVEARQARCVVDRICLAAYGPPDRPWVLSLHDHDSRFLRSQPVPRSLVRGAEHLWDLATLGPFERSVVGRPGTTVIAVSEDDARGLGPHVAVVPNGTDVPASIVPRPDGVVPLFVGALDYAPNAEAVRWWADAVWPLLDGSVPPLRVVGRGPAALGSLRSRPSITVVGEVESIASELAAATMVVVPLRSGGGTRLKVLEAFAWGRPVVSTTKGAEGLPGLDGRYLLLADDPAAFAAQVVRLATDRALGDRLAVEARNFVAPYDWPRVGAAFADLVISALRPAPPPGRR